MRRHDRTRPGRRHPLNRRLHPSAGHHGAHDGYVPLGARHVTGELRGLPDTVKRDQRELRMDRPDVDWDIAGAPGPIANRHDALANLAARLDTIARRADRLAADVRRVEARAPGPAPAAGSGLPGAQRAPGYGSPSVEL